MLVRQALSCLAAFPFLLPMPRRNPFLSLPGYGLTRRLKMVQSLAFPFFSLYPPLLHTWPDIKQKIISKLGPETALLHSFDLMRAN